ncbi:hypothetical protein ACS0TY_002680 [Phlomoides rotata]
MLARNPHLTLLSLLLLIPSSVLVQGILCVKYKVTNNAGNTPGGERFNTEIGIPFTLKTAEKINAFIWKLFKQDTAAKRRKLPVLNINITILTDGAWGETGFDTVYIDTGAIQNNFPAGREAGRYEFTSLLYHEMTHIFQWHGNGTAPGGLSEGVAEYVKIKSKYYHPEGYTKPGEGSKWDEGYGVTARFLEYCDSLRPDFTPDFNNKMRYVYKEEYFQDFLGKTVDQIWNEYKAKYAN